VARSPTAVPEPAPPLPPLSVDRTSGYDRANAERLKRGKHPVEARLDLHGLTQAEAHRALAGFLRGARATGKRCVLVVTGRGSTGSGVLRNAVPRWLDEPEFRPHVLAIATAQPRDGGAGALYVMLRRTRTG
jgi:DNA-nicking Smr family endonuclease